MALLGTSSRCPLCNESIDVDAANTFFSLPYVGIAESELAVIDDANVHNDCFLKWVRRNDFIKAFNFQGELKLFVRNNGEICLKRPGLLSKFFLRGWR
jgi:hypothetical protein